jgi:hypothetical protein
MQGLFNWLPSAAGSGETVDVVNKKFWIYWAISAPLTAATIVGWAIWWRYEMRRYPTDPSDNTAAAPAGFAAQIMETLGWTAGDVNPPPVAKRKLDNWVFGGRRRQSKLGIDGNPDVDPADLLMDTEAGAVRSPITSPKSPLRTSTQTSP